MNKNKISTYIKNYFMNYNSLYLLTIYYQLKIKV